ncbi:MAG: vitamin K epoxide reductase family protein [Anaerolineae bacterium]|nr:vitamin K epoxide reductase family protein [Anaerolineae bacterium]
MSAAQNTMSGSPRTDWLRIACIALVIGALGISGYLSYTELTRSSVACLEVGGFDCDLVQNSSYSKVMGIPVGVLGFLANLFLLALLVLEDRIAFLQDNGITIFFATILFAVLFSLWLIYVQAVLLKAFCVWCLAHELIVAALFILAILRLRSHLAGGEE